MRLGLALLAPLLVFAGFASAAHAQPGGEIDFGDNTSNYADNGECDDPRFEGDGMASILVSSDLRHDAADCAAGVAAGTVALKALPVLADNAPSQALDTIDFGDDASGFALDGACDDPRFAGRSMAGVLIAPDLGHDASDCRAGMVIGDLVFIGADGRQSEGISGAGSIDPASVDLSGIDFGDNSSPYALNETCDDRRFKGEAMSSFLLDSDTGHDASDCAGAMIEGKLSYRQPVAAADIDFGDDDSAYAANSECDDPRFLGEGMAEVVLESDIGHDAADCRAGVESGALVFIGTPD